MKKRDIDFVDNSNNRLKRLKGIDDEGDISEKQNLNSDYSLNKEQVEPLEILFWKVFRNVFLFKLIFSNFNSIFYRYQDLVGAEYVLDSFSNGISIIKDKLKQSQYIIKNNQEFIIVFGQLKKDTSENQQFIHYIFDNYKTNNKEESFYNHRLWIKIIITSLNIVALEIYKSKFNISVSDIRNYIQEYWKDNEFLHLFSKQFKSMKMYHHLRSKEYILSETLNTQSFYLFYPSFKFKHLIKYYKSLATYNNTDGDNTKKKLVERLNNIDIGQFSLNILNSPILELLKYKIIINDSDSSGGSELKFIIKDYVEAVSLFSYVDYSFERDEQFSFFFKDTTISDVINNKTTSILYCSLLSLEDQFKMVQDLFKDQEFIEYNNEGINNKKIVPLVHNLFDSLLSSSSIEIIRYILENHSDRVFYEFPTCRLFSNIQTKEILEYYFENYREKMFHNSSFLNSKRIDLEILGHLEKLLFKSNGTIVLNSGNFSLEVIQRAIFNNPPVYQFLSFSIESCSPIFQSYIEDGNCKIIISILSQINTQPLINLSSALSFLSCYSSKVSLLIRKSKTLLSWLFDSISLEYIINYIDSNKISPEKNPFLPFKFQHPNNPSVKFSISIRELLNFISFGRPNSTFEVYCQFDFSLSMLFKETGVINFSNKTLELFIFHFLNLVNFRNNDDGETDFFSYLIHDNDRLLTLYNFLRVASRRGLLQVFKKIMLQYDSILKKKSKDNHYIFEEFYIVNIINEATDFLNFELSHFLINHSDIDIKFLKSNKNKRNNNNLF